MEVLFVLRVYLSANEDSDMDSLLIKFITMSKIPIITTGGDPLSPKQDESQFRADFNVVSFS